MNQNTEIVISFDPEGGVSALHMDEFPLSFLGRMDIGRASTIDFNPETQCFDINLKGATNYEHIWSDWPPGEYEVGDIIHYHAVPAIVLDWKYPKAALGFTGYDEARAYEVTWIQECTKRDIDPLDWEGVRIIDSLRQGGSPQL